MDVNVGECGLVGMVTSKVGKRYAFTGFEALKEMFISRLLFS